MPKSSETSTSSKFDKSEKRINRTDLAYIAGFLDGDGSISAKHKKPHNCVVTRVCLYNTERSVLEWIATRIGGRIYTQPGRLGKKVQHQLEVRTGDLRWFLKLMIPFLKVKAGQLRVALILLSMTERKAELTRKLKWVSELSRLNRT